MSGVSGAAVDDQWPDDQSYETPQRMGFSKNEPGF